MAEQVGSAVIGEITKRAFSKVIKRFDKQTALDEKLEQLEMLAIKLHSTVEAAEKHSIENTWLLQWQQKLKNAAAQGDDVLLGFKQRAVDEAAENASTSGPSLALPFSSMAMCIRTAAKMLFSNDEDMEKLNSTVERLEKLSADIGEFIKLLELEALPKEVDISLKRKKSNPPLFYCFQSTSSVFCLPADEWIAPMKLNYNDQAAVALCWTVERLKELVAKILEVTETADDQKLQDQRLLVERLEKPVDTISKAVEMADGRELQDQKWHGKWAKILGLAVKQADIVLGAFKGQAGSETVQCAADQDSSSAASCLHDQRREFRESDELESFVQSLERLADDVGDFSRLVLLSPSK